jgi:hypothetical protein
MLSGAKSDRKAAAHMLAELDKYHGLPNGMFSCDEHLAGRNPVQGSELCTVVETMFSLEQALAISGDSALGDRLEQLAFNALPGAISDDMWSHQYNQEPNQVECSLHSKPWTTDGPESNIFGLQPNFGCCAANFHQGWPKFATSLVMQTHDDGLAVTAYGPCEVHTLIRDTAVHLSEQTDYPFHGMIRITVNPASPIAFPLLLRIPAWAQGAQMRVNGKRLETRISTPEAGTFARIERTWNRGDVVELRLPMEPRVVAGYNDSVSVERGALVFSLGIGEDWLKLRDYGKTADWQIYPTTPWNYALALPDPSATPTPVNQIAVTELEVGSTPFTSKFAPVKMQVKARKVSQWQAVDGVADPMPQAPVASSEPDEVITLIPYAAAKLRITSFPRLKAEAAAVKPS